MKIKVGTRKSPLALKQTEEVINKIKNSIMFSFILFSPIKEKKPSNEKTIQVIQSCTESSSKENTKSNFCIQKN